MLRKLALLLFTAVFTLSFAQVVISPTTGSGADAVNVGTTTASVQQNVNLKLPAATALHLDVTNLTFDISKIGAEDSTTWACVYGKDFRGTDTNGGVFNGQMQVLPLGTSYKPNKNWTASTMPTITLQNHGQVVTSYPPRIIGSNGELVDGSKNHFVCYRTFILQKFSNYGSWSLSVSRAGDSTFDMYIQDNTYCSFNNDQATGLFKLNKGTPVNLLPASLTNGTTGALAAACGQAGKSWLDDLVVIAVKVDGERHGDNVEKLTYTLTSTVPQ